MPEVLLPWPASDPPIRSFFLRDFPNPTSEEAVILNVTVHLSGWHSFRPAAVALEQFYSGPYSMVKPKHKEASITLAKNMMQKHFAGASFGMGAYAQWAVGDGWSSSG